MEVQISKNLRVPYVELIHKGEKKYLCCNGVLFKDSEYQNYEDLQKEYERREKAEMLLERVGLKERMKHLPSELSGGQKQRVAIARALVNDPAILLADEPTGALDSKTGDQIMELFQELNEEGRTVIFVTHDRKLGMRCNSQVYIKDGVTVEGY